MKSCVIKKQCEPEKKTHSYKELGQLFFINDGSSNPVGSSSPG